MSLRDKVVGEVTTGHERGGPVMICSWCFTHCGAPGILGVRGFGRVGLGRVMGWGRLLGSGGGNVVVAKAVVGEHDL